MRHPQIEYVRVRQDGVEFTTARSSVKKAMTVLKDADATDKRGNPLPPTTTSGSKSGNKSGSGSAASDKA